MLFAFSPACLARTDALLKKAPLSIDTKVHRLKKTEKQIGTSQKTNNCKEIYTKRELCCRNNSLFVYTRGKGAECILRFQESFAEDLACLCNNDECVRVDLLDLFAEAGGFKSLADRDHNLARFSRIGTARVIERRAVIHLVKNKFVDLFRFCRDNGKRFTHIEVFDDVIQQKDLGEQTERREETCAHIVYEEGGNRDDDVCDEQCLSDVETRIFFQYQGNDVGAAARCVAVKEDRRAEAGQKDGKHQFEQWLIRQRGRQRQKPLKELVDKRNHQSTQDRLESATAAEEQDADHKKHDVQNRHVSRLRKGGEELCKENGDAADAADGEAVRCLKKVNAGGNYDIADAK